MAVATLKNTNCNSELMRTGLSAGSSRELIIASRCHIFLRDDVYFVSMFTDKENSQIYSCYLRCDFERFENTLTTDFRSVFIAKSSAITITHSLTH